MVLFALRQSPTHYFRAVFAAPMAWPAALLPFGTLPPKGLPAKQLRHWALAGTLAYLFLLLNACGGGDGKKMLSPGTPIGAS